MNLQNESLRKIKRYFKFTRFLSYFGWLAGAVTIAAAVVLTVLYQTGGLSGFLEGLSGGMGLNLEAPGINVRIDDSQLGVPVFILMNYGIIIIWGLLMYVLLKLKGILANTIKQQTPFDRNNTVQLRKIAYAFLLYAVIFPLFELIMGRVLIAGNAFERLNQLEGIEIYHSVSVQDWALILGFVILLLAEIFKHGLKLQQDSESIV